VSIWLARCFFRLEPDFTVALKMAKTVKIDKPEIVRMIAEFPEKGFNQAT
jgi:hypothetical protein